jgi:hypothetical protein
VSDKRGLGGVGGLGICDGTVTEKTSQRPFRPWFEEKKIVCLNIPDKYGYMQPELVTVLRAKVLPQLRGLKCSKDLNSI